jgi:type III restriction enzyme
MAMDIIAPQSAVITPEEFQATLIANVTAALLRHNPAPVLLRAPTGSGKTFMITRILQDVTQSSPTLWLWFVPFVNLVQQTEDSIASNATTLSPVSLLRGRNQDPQSGLVVISTAAAVARSKSRKESYTDGEDDTTRSLDSQFSLARAKGLKIGLVVDEAHIGLDTQTEFGQFVNWLKPDRMLMASATPKDQRLIDFIQSAGYSSFEPFNVGRDDVVKARLNKRYIEAIVYDLRQSIQTVTDLQQTVLKQAWRQNQRLKRLLESLEIQITPLLLVQVANGEKTVEQARDQLISLCKVPASAIGVHSSDDPDPVLMASIASDTTKEVLIFKQSAGTGFDAPRAFVLASTKPVNDPDFAAQFIGRVMRVHRAIRAKYPKTAAIDPVLDCAYIYLANAQAQQGFEQAVAATSGLQSQLAGQTEKLVPRRMASGAVVYTNRTTDTSELFPDTALPQPGQPTRAPGVSRTSNYGATASLPGFDPTDSSEDALDTPLDDTPTEQPPAQKDGSAPEGNVGKRVSKPGGARSKAEFSAGLLQIGLAAYPKRPAIAALPQALRTELRPEMGNMAAAARAAATKLNIDHLAKAAADMALDRVRDKEIHTELTTQKRTEQKVNVVVDRSALAREAHDALMGLPQVEEEDASIIIEVLTKRLRPVIEAEMGEEEQDRAGEAGVTKAARSAAYAVIRKEREALAELLHEEISNQAQTVEAEPLPDALLFASDLPLETSSKNIYGVLPPSKEEVGRLPDVITVDVREAMVERSISLTDGAWKVAPFDGAWALGHEERAFAKALDRAEFVHWWHRNPDRKGFSVRIVRGEHKNYFYPDFVVCLEHFPGDDPLMRLVETKDSIKDAMRKAKRPSPSYGKVLFMTKDMSKWKWIGADGQLGSEIDLDDLAALQDWMRKTVPSANGSMTS